jgi:hypothetical protein
MCGDTECPSCGSAQGTYMSKQEIEEQMTLAFRWWRFRVCLFCLWYLHHWPMDDLYDEEWLDHYLGGYTAFEEFVEGWCRD